MKHFPMVMILSRLAIFFFPFLSVSGFFSFRCFIIPGTTFSYLPLLFRPAGLTFSPFRHVLVLIVSWTSLIFFLCFRGSWRFVLFSFEAQLPMKKFHAYRLLQLRS